MINNVETFFLNNEKATKLLARNVARSLAADSTLLISGTIGSGKTFFCREIIRFFCGSNTSVISPTFNLMQIYETSNIRIVHCDLFRLKSVQEFYEIGLEEFLDSSLCLIEWPDIVEKNIVLSYSKVHLDFIKGKNRLCTITR